MSDQYPRVWVRATPNGDVECYDPTSLLSGPLKVVPADAIVIERDELPNVVADKHVISGPLAFPSGTDPEEARRLGLAYLAAAEYLAAHPPVNEAQVALLAQFLSNEGGGGIWEEMGTAEAQIVARRLVEMGWSKPEPTR